MIRIQTKKSKTTQYVIGGVVAVVILAIWISLPLMSGSSLDSSVSAGNPFRSRVADISLLSDIPSEGGAPGSPLSGDMINNPATSGEDIASSLFQSGPEAEEEQPSATATADASASAPSPSSSSDAPVVYARPGGKLAAAPSLSGSNSNTMTTGGAYNKFFGNGNQKAEFAPAAGMDAKKPPLDKKHSLASMLNSSAEKSKSAAKSGNMDLARGGAASAFGGSGGKTSANLDESAEESAVQSGLQLGQTAQDLKKNDPSLSKTKVTPPAAPEDVTDKNEEMKKEIMKMIIQMVVQSTLSSVLGLPLTGK